MASQTIERLPPELLIHCCPYLKGSIVDIQNLRLTSKITTKSLLALEAVSNHTIFHKSITTMELSLCFYGDIQDEPTKDGLKSECDRRFRSIGLTITRIFNSTRRTAEELELFNRIQARLSDMRFALDSLYPGAIEDRPPSLSSAHIRMMANTFDVYNTRFVDQQAVIKRGSHLKRIGAALSKFRRPLSFEIFGNIEVLNEIDCRSCSMATIMEWLNSDEICSDIVLDVLESRVRWWSKQNLEFGVVIPAEQHYEEMQHLASLTTAFLNTESTWTGCKFSTEAGEMHFEFCVDWITWKKYRAGGLVAESMELAPTRMVWYFASLKTRFANIFSK
ncbi:hypothetical protein RJZ56_001190 [Blastomyces dermatitidis]